MSWKGGPKLNSGDTLVDLAPALLYKPEQDGCRWAARCAECPRPECDYDASQDAARRRAEKEAP